MKNDDAGIEQKLRALQWRAPQGAALEQSLKAALAERAAVVKVRRGRWLDLVPRAVRWPLAACWTASLLFWWMTPRTESSSALAVSTEKREADPALMLAERESSRQLTHELLLAIENHGQHY